MTAAASSRSRLVSWAKKTPQALQLPGVEGERAPCVRGWLDSSAAGQRAASGKTGQRANGAASGPATRAGFYASAPATCGLTGGAESAQDDRGDGPVRRTWPWWCTCSYRSRSHT